MNTHDRWVILGSGTLEYHPDRGPSCHLLESGASRILVDSGPGCLHRVAARGLGAGAVDAVVHSHLHLDHTADLFPLLFGELLAARDRPLSLVGAAGHEAWVRGVIERLYPKLTSLPLAFIEQPEDAVSRPLCAGLSLAAFPAEHSQAPRLLRFEGDGWAVTYSGDTGPAGDLVEAARGVDWLVIECTAPDGVPRGKHLCPAAVASVIRVAQPRAVALVHLSPLWVRPGDAAKAVRAHLGADAPLIIGARDGAELPLPYSHSMVPGGLLEMS